MVDIQKILAEVKPDIEKIERAIHHDLKDISKTMDELLVEILEYGLLSGGKLLRPLLAVLSSRMCGKDDSSVYKLSIGFEYLHLATLMHDDVIDQADIRRGRATVSSRFGLSAAILAGDFLHARSMEIIGSYSHLDSLHVFCGATKGMVDGEFRQLRNSEIYNQSESDYFSAIEGKTALLIAAATEIGSIYGGASDIQRKSLTEYGRYLGFAFQIADDLLDYLGDEKKTGKAVGNDLAEGKMTLPLIYALDGCTENDRAAVLKILQNDTQRTSSFDDIKSLIVRCGGFDKARSKAEHCMNEAMRVLDVFLPENHKEVEILQGLARYAVSREK